MAALKRALDRAAARYMLIGGLAVIARGVIRSTDDADATVWGPQIELEHLLACLASEGIVGRITDVADFARSHQVLLLEHEASGTPMEVTLAWLPFEDEAIERAEELDLGGVRLPVALADDLIVYKVVAWRDRDRADVERLLRLHGPHIDMARVRGLIAEFASALEEPERIEEFERLVRKALPRS
ncbi:MAG TPA: DUF6036 family nucleotidyltransferase [Kofleriaceae bacterium]|nr:DUF6036 family nucleotidyltransferase [Kofleriaceae bacterium]